MTTTSRPRAPKGTRIGGQFAKYARPEAHTTLELPDTLALATPQLKVNGDVHVTDAAALPDGVRVLATNPTTGRTEMGQVIRKRGVPHLVGNTRSPGYPITGVVTMDLGSAVRLLPHVEQHFTQVQQDWFTNPNTKVSDNQMTQTAAAYARSVQQSLPQYAGDTTPEHEQQLAICQEIADVAVDQADYDGNGRRTREVVDLATYLYEYRENLGQVQTPDMSQLADEAATLPVGEPQPPVV